VVNKRAKTPDSPSYSYVADSPPPAGLGESFGKAVGKREPDTPWAGGKGPQQFAKTSDSEACDAVCIESDKEDGAIAAVAGDSEATDFRPGAVVAGTTQ
jgi:hypothetical protein